MPADFLTKKFLHLNIINVWNFEKCLINLFFSNAPRGSVDIQKSSWRIVIKQIRYYLSIELLTQVSVSYLAFQLLYV